jgi:tRNA-(ms[2]io[6]A)-hydroxylase
VLNLRSDTDDAWLQVVDDHLDEILIDHAHCERKAAMAAMTLLTAYVENEPLCLEMTTIVQEELEHFHLVRRLLDERGIAFRRQRQSSYGSRLHALVRRDDPQRAVDRLLVASLIEARSCERFSRLADHVQDESLAAFYRGLFESEARHHTTYVRLAKDFAPDAEVESRLVKLAVAEAEIIANGDGLARMHS